MSSEGCQGEVWVTSALNEEELRCALVLAFSLRRSLTTRKIALFASQELPAHLKKAIKYVFDLVFVIENEHNTAKLRIQDYTKIYSVAALCAFDKCVYLSPTLLAVQNCDSMFSQHLDTFCLLPDASDTSVFSFIPSIDLFDGTMSWFGNQKSDSETSLGKLLYNWMTNQSQLVPKLEYSYFYGGINLKSLMRHKNEIAMVNIPDCKTVLEIENLAKIGILEGRVAGYWLQLYRESVLPLMNTLNQGIINTRPKSISEVKTLCTFEPIAVVGMSCRYPGSNSLDEFWDLLSQGRDGTRTPPPFRWLPDQYPRYVADARKINAGFLNIPVDEFDAKFFGISPKEALMMDPQHRILHEVVWEALEDAGIDPLTLHKTSGAVFLGWWLNNYKEVLSESDSTEFFRQYLGTSSGAGSGRISFHLGMTGPSISTESGCSSSMVAVNLACKSLQKGETSLALACGVNIILRPFDKDEMPMVFSADGHCKTFSEDANGFARGEGIGVLVLKRLSEAQKDGDHIWSLIRGSAVVQDGLSKSLGTPTIDCETHAMQQAMSNARVSPEEISYVEAHGTGTIVGDPMEVAAIANAYGTPNRKTPLIIGSVKTNVGHTEACSGITGIMKVILALHHESIPAHINFTKLNPSIDLNAVPATIPLESVQWKKTLGKPRIAGVSSFGITGTDAHVIVQEAPQKLLSPLSCDMERPMYLLKLSVKSEEAMKKLLEKYRKHVENSMDTLANIAYSANVGRSNFPIRAVVIGKNKVEICKAIEQQKYFKSEVKPENYQGSVCFLFTGQGSQYKGMAQQLYQTSFVFRMHFDYCVKILKEVYNIDIIKTLWSASNSGNSEINRTIYSQTSIFCVEYALFKLWESFGIKPDYVLGHSLGEFAASVCAGMISVEDAIMLVAERSRLIDELPQGKMLVIKASKQEVEKLMKNSVENGADKLLDYAAVNSTEQTVIAGDTGKVLQFFEVCKEKNVKCTLLETTHAFHSQHMDPMLESYMKIAKTVKPQSEQKCQFISGMRGDVVNIEDINAKYWVDHTREKVNFLHASVKAVELGCHTFIEIGPQPVLSALTLINNEKENLVCLPSLKRNADDWTTMLTTLGNLYIRGSEIDWAGVDKYCNREKVRLPHYPFIRKKFWPNIMAKTGQAIHPLLGISTPNPSSIKIFQCNLEQSTHEWIMDHTIGQHVVFPGAGYLEMSMVAGFAAIHNAENFLSKPSRAMKIENLTISAPLALIDGKSKQLQTVVELKTDKKEECYFNDISVKIFSRNGTDSADWLQHTNCTFSSFLTAEEKTVPFTVTNISEINLTRSNSDMITQLYTKLASMGLVFGSYFRSIEYLWNLSNDNIDNYIVTKVKIPKLDPQFNQYIIHPVILDAMLQTIMMMKLSSNLKKKLHVPIKIGKFVWLTSMMEIDSLEEIYIQAVENSGQNLAVDQASTLNCCATLMDSLGNPLAVMSGVEFIDTTVSALEAVLENQVSPMPDLWEEVWRPTLAPTQHSADLDIFGKATKQVEKFHTQNNMEQIYNDNPEALSTLRQMDKLVYYYMLKGLYECGWKPIVNTTFDENELFCKLIRDKSMLKQFKYFLRIFEEEALLKKEQHSQISALWRIISSPPSWEEILAELSSPHYTTELVGKFKSTLLLSKVGDNLSQIFQENQSILSILFPEDANQTDQPSAAEFYIDYPKLINFFPMATELAKNWFEEYRQQAILANHGRSIFRILELGAGTGGYTGIFLDILNEKGIEYEYTYTDISAAFFSTAEKKFEKYSENMTFRKLNLEEDPISQGFIPSYYDLICASDVIHATKNLKDTLGSVRCLLKPRGVFNLVEQTQVGRFITFVFGLLDGFWRFEDLETRPNHCILTKKAWKEVLEANCFQVTGQFSSAQDHHSFMLSIKNSHISNGIADSFTNNQETATWIVFHQKENKLSEYLLQNIPKFAENRKTIVVTKGSHFENTKDHFTLRSSSENDFHQMMEHLTSQRCPKIEGIVYCWSLDNASCQQEDVLQPYFLLAKSLHLIKQSYAPKLCMLTQHGVPVIEGEMSKFYSSTLWGFTKSLDNENTHIQCKCIDVGSISNEGDMQQILYEIYATRKEVEVAYNGSSRYVPKLTLHRPTIKDLPLPVGVDKFQLILPESKRINDLSFGPSDPQELKVGDVEIQVKSCALNFRDVFSVLKPSDEFKNINEVGIDFAGVVSRVHQDVSRWKPGDHVFGVNFSNKALPSHIVMQHDMIIPIPDDMTFSEACTLPAVVSTSYHCLLDLAKITSKDIVLIHTATGGVGLSAIQICRSVGATIIATAGSKRKQNFLRALGIQHIFHSRNTNYGDQILKVTEGRGVTVVLNSLTSEGFKEATLKACAQGARFIEMSKLSIWTTNEIKQLRPDVQYTVVDLSIFVGKELQRLLNKLSELISKKEITAIPFVRFDGVNIREALQYLQKAKHIGKVVCTMPEVKHCNGKTETWTPMFNTRSTYLITGGLGGIGFEVCKWMIGKGAKYVILAGRSTPNINTQQQIRNINNQFDSKISTVQLDVSNFDQCQELILRKVPEMGYPTLRGVMHTAGTLNDGLIENHSWNTLSSTFKAKVIGTLNLHELTKNNCQIEHFVLFSSFAALFGSPGQSNHAAGNCFEDAMAHYRHSIGLPASSINWGQWGQVGVATEVELPGIKPLSTLQGIAGLEYCLRSQQTQLSVINIESFAAARKLFPHISSYIDDHLLKSSKTAKLGTSNVTSEDFWSTYMAAKNIDEKLHVLVSHLKLILRSVLNLDDSDVIEDNTDFLDLGFDSLMFVELKNALQSLLGDRVAVHTSTLRDCNTAKLLAKSLLIWIDGEESKVILGSEQPIQEKVDALIHEDITLSQNILPRANQITISPDKISCILLTGGTGTLGSYVLKELAQQKQITEIICLLRPKKQISTEQRLKNTVTEKCLASEIDFKKVRCVEGNVAMTNLGIESTVWKELSDKVDAVVHCAVKFSHREYYQKYNGTEDVRTVNVQGMKNVLEFACTGQKLKHVYCASNLIALASIDDETNLSETWPESGGYDGVTTAAYPISKFVGEILMKQAVLERNIPGKVFRFPFIMGDSKTGRFNLSQNHLMLRYVSILRHGVMPKNPSPPAMVPVDICAWASIQLFLNPQVPNDVYNIINVIPDLGEGFTKVAEKLGFSINIVELSEFTKRIQEARTDDSKSMLFNDVWKENGIMSIYSGLPALQQWVLDRDSKKDYMVSKKLEKFLPAFSQGHCSTMEYIQKHLEFALAEGMLEGLGLST